MKTTLYILLLAMAAAAMPKEMRISIAYGNGRFVAVLAKSIITSYNGSEWEWVFGDGGGSQSYYTGITFGKDKFVAVGIYGKPYDSKENIFTRPFMGSVISVPYEGLNSVAFGGNQFVAVGARGKILFSSDAVTWSECITGHLDNLTSVTYNSGKFVATGSGGSIFISSDAHHWTKTLVSQSFVFNTITAGFNGNVITNRGQLFSSGNFLNWKLNDLKLKSPIYSCAWGENLFIIVGKKGTVLNSPDGNKWQDCQLDTSLNLLSVCYGNGKYVALDSCYAVISSDGVHWDKSKWR